MEPKEEPEDLLIMTRRFQQVCIYIFSSPELKTQVSYCHSTPSVNFSHFQLLLQNRLMDFDETWQG